MKNNRIKKKASGFKKVLRQATNQEAPDWQNKKLKLAEAIVKELKKINKQFKQTNVQLDTMTRLLEVWYSEDVYKRKQKRKK